MLGRMVENRGDIYGSELTQNLYRKMKENEYCDLVLMVGKQEFHCHKLVVFAACPLLERFSGTIQPEYRTGRSKVQSLSLDFTTPKVVELLLRYFYTGEVPLDDHAAKEEFEEVKKHLYDPELQCQASDLEDLKSRIIAHFKSTDGYICEHSEGKVEKTTAIVEIEEMDDMRFIEKIGDSHSGHVEEKLKHCASIPQRPKQKKLTKNRLYLPKLPPFLCPSDSCGKIFETQEKLRSHYRHNHGEKKYKCSRCPLRFLYPKDLTSHFRTHTGEKPYVCDVCGKGFAQLGSMYIHSRIHGRERTSSDSSAYPCAWCLKKYLHKEKQGLAATVDITKLDLLTLCCPNENCAKKFASVQSLRKHVKNGICSINKLSCEECKTNFDSLQDVRRHIATTHCIHKRIRRKAGTRSQVEVYQEDQIKADEPDTAFQCSFCGHLYKTPGDMDQHMFTHENMTTSTCNASHVTDPVEPTSQIQFEHNAGLLELCSEVVMEDDITC